MTAYSNLESAPAYPEQGMNFNELTAQLPNWACWRPGQPEKREKGKVPLNPRTGGNASVNSSPTWGTRAEALKKANQLRQEHGDAGIGIMLSDLPQFPGYCLAGIDIDGCKEGPAGEIHPIIAELIEKFDTYAEISPSGCGIHIFFVCHTSVRENLKSEGFINPGAKWGRDFHPTKGIEFAPRLGGGKFLTFTGDGIAPVNELIGPGPVRELSYKQCEWIFGEFGEKFLATFADTDECPTASESRSEQLVSFFIRCQKRGLSKGDAIDCLQEEGHPGWDHAQDQTDAERALNRAWAAAERFVRSDREKLSRVVEDTFAELDNEDWGSEDPIVDRLNKQFGVVDIPNNTVIARFAEDRLDLLPRSAFELKLSNKSISIGDKKQSVARYWLQHAERREFEGLVFDPSGKAAKKYLNLFRGFAHNPPYSSENCEWFWELMFETICRGDDQLFDYFRNWMAHLAQFPWEKPGVAIVFVGGRGVGKDTALSYLGRILRPANYRSVSQPRHVVGNFNANQKECLFLHMQEGVFTGNKAECEQLKAVITSERVLIEPKGLEPFEIDSFMRLGISTNSLSAVPAAADERRFAVAECGPKQSSEFYERVYDERESFGPSALMRDLMSVDLTGFNVRRAPKSEGLQQQKLSNLSGVEAWWLDVLVSGKLPSSPFCVDQDVEGWEDRPISICKDTLRSAFADWNNRQRYTGNPPTSPLFTKILLSVCPSIRDSRLTKDGSRVRCFKIPQLGQCIEDFERVYDVKLDLNKD